MTQAKLITMDAGTLLTTPLPPTRFIIGGILPQGLNILAGAPKIGKSTMSEVIGEGLEKQIEDFMKSHPDTVLIVIDTLQRIRNVTADINQYAGDYRDVGILKALADKYRIAILLVHHLRKMNDDDPMNMIYGTTGISGATDSYFVLKKDKRGGNSATLYCVGRDIQELTAPILNELIDRIEVGKKETVDGVKRQDIRIVYKQFCYVEFEEFWDFPVTKKERTALVQAAV